MGKGELVVYEGGPTDIAVARPPEVVLEEAHRAAKALTDVISKKPKKVIMNGEQYLEFEDWQTVGRFYGVTVKVASTEFIDYGGAKGFLAKAVVLRQDGAEISAAEAMCLNDEEKWSTRPKYEWQDVKDATGKTIWEPNPDKPGKNRPKRERVKIGDEPVPLFQLRSMAQTRACAKALRNVLAWVVVLAGYKPTPAEEMEGVYEPAPGAANPPSAAPTGEPKIATASAPPSQHKDDPKTDEEIISECILLANEYAVFHGWINSNTPKPDIDKALGDVIQQFSQFSGTDKKTGTEKLMFRRSPESLVTDKGNKWLLSTYGKLREAVNELRSVG